MTRRVAMAGFLHETNTFAPSPATYAGFEQGGKAGFVLQIRDIASDRLAHEPPEQVSRMSIVSGGCERSLARQAA